MAYATLLPSLRERRSCLGKRAYTTRSEAKWGMRSFARYQYAGDARGLRVYRCDFCASYHFGHRSEAVAGTTIPG